MRKTNMKAIAYRNSLLPLPAMVLMLCCCCHLLRAQDATANDVYDAYKQIAMNIQNLSYSVKRVDTFLSGDIRSVTGNCLLLRQPENKLIGCTFAGKRIDLPVTNWYDGTDFYTINDDEKSFSVNHTPGKGILGSVGGQMLCTDLFQPDNDYSKLSLTVLPDFYVLRMDFPDLKKYDAFNRYKVLYLDKKSLLLQRIEAYQQSHEADKKQVTIETFSDIYVNDPITAIDINKKDNIKSYKEQAATQNNEELAPPIKKKGGSYKVQGSKNKN